MEDQTSCLLDWSYFCHGKSTDELTESLLLTTMELEATRFKAQQELKLKDDQLTQLKHLLNNAINQRDEAQNIYQKLLLHYHQNHHQTTTTPPPQLPPPHSAVSSIEDEPITNTGFSSSDCEESIVSSPPRLSEQEFPFPVVALPEKGKLLEAVMKAGPLLQNLLLAGPLPHWRHPPPPLDTYQIPPPPVVLPSPPDLVWKLNKKRGSPEGSDSSTETKYQRIAIN
ncbi:hypothetical protein L6452_29570 [Arctium lappa]|uniref:Uncharacterized protein n=1 Tax=Arctium lappa TaxID=4217 RepID=A0ACB8ZI32_ARCLA|nr:hypothetical protein L6452_29570 [Arctium lappa]